MWNGGFSELAVVTQELLCTAAVGVRKQWLFGPSQHVVEIICHIWTCISIWCVHTTDTRNEITYIDKVWNSVVICWWTFDTVPEITWCIASKPCKSFTPFHWLHAEDGYKFNTHRFIHCWLPWIHIHTLCMCRELQHHIHVHVHTWYMYTCIHVYVHVVYTPQHTDFSATPLLLTPGVHFCPSHPPPTPTTLTSFLKGAQRTGVHRQPPLGCCRYHQGQW